MKVSMNRRRYRVALAAALAAAGAAGNAVAEPAEWRSIEAGRVLAEANCASCHAIAKSDASPNASAPPFRTLSAKYPVESLEEALAEGISVGHADMPEFRFEPGDVDALVAYLKSIQPPAKKY